MQITMTETKRPEAINITTTKIHNATEKDPNKVTFKKSPHYLGSLFPGETATVWGLFLHGNTILVCMIG